MDILNELENVIENMMGSKGEKVKIVKSGKGELTKYTLQKPNGSKLIDMEFDSEEKAKKYAEKKGLKIA
jgi:hypothetical protein